MAGIVPADLRKRMTRLQKSIARSKGPATKRRAELQRLAARRRRIVENATVYNPGATLSGDRLRTTVDELVRGEVDPLKRKRASLEAGGQRSIADIESVFRTLGESQQAALQASAGIGARQQEQLGQIGQQNVAAQQAAAANANATLDRDAALRGAGNAGSREQLAQTIASRGADTAQLLGAQQAQGAQIANSGQLLASQLAQSQQMRGGEMTANARMALAQRLAETDAEIADVQGPGRTKLLNDLRAAERQWLGEQQAFGINTAKLAADTQIKKAGIKQRDKASQRTAHQKALDRRQRRRDAAADRKLKRELKAMEGTGTTGKEAAKNRKARRAAIDQAIAVTRQQNRKHPLYGHKNRRTQAVDQIVEAYREDGVTREDAQRIVWAIAFPGVRFYGDKPKKAKKRHSSQGP